MGCELSVPFFYETEKGRRYGKYTLQFDDLDGTCPEKVSTIREMKELYGEERTRQIALDVLSDEMGKELTLCSEEEFLDNADGLTEVITRDA